MKIEFIAAVSKNGVIGKDGALPWSIPQDLKRFRTLTLGSTLIMGHNTYKSLPRFLGGRKLIVISSNPSACNKRFLNGEDTHFCTMESYTDYLPSMESSDTVFVIGGESIFQHFMESASRIHMTYVEKNIQSDGKSLVKFPPCSRFVVENVHDRFFCENENCFVEFLTLTSIPTSSSEMSYLDLLKDIIAHGTERTDRTGTGTLSTFARQIRFDISKSIPLLTTKFTGWKTCIQELLWFLAGDTNAKHLQENGVHIWDGNTTREFLDKRGLHHLPEGDIGAGYGFQWRHFGATYETCNDNYDNQGVDQIQQVLEQLQKDPMSRRHVVTAWNPSALPSMALPPCHAMFQFYVEEVGQDKHLSCHMYQRSVDCFLGLPFNILSYAVLTYIMAAKTGMKPKELIISTGDTHIYMDHLQQVQEQLSRDPYPFPKLVMSDDVALKKWNELSMDDFHIHGYLHHPVLKGKMSV